MAVDTIKNEDIILGIIIDTDLKVPPNTGVTYRLYYLSKKLVEKGIKVKLLICNRGFESKNDLKKIFSESGIEIHIIPQNVFYSSCGLENIVKASGINILQFESAATLIRFHQISNNLKIPTCLEMHDVEATLAEKLGFDESDVALAKIFAAEAVRLSERTVCMTQTDIKELTEIVKVDHKKLSIVPNPIDLDEFPYIGPKIDSSNILFIGNMFYWPNQNAAQFIINDLYPQLTKIRPDSSFLLVGMVPEQFKRIAEKKKNVVVTGPVDQLNDALKLGTIALCPVTEGSGMKVKILNYSAAGLPIISTRIGASGYEDIPSLIIEDDLSKYPSIISSLLIDKKMIVSVGRENRKFVQENYNVEVLAEKIILIYKTLVSSGVCLKETDFLKRYDIDLFVPLWVRETRARSLSNNTYYVVKNNQILYSESYPKVYIIEGFWGAGKTTLINEMSRIKGFTTLSEPDHLAEKIDKDVSAWYLSQHDKRLELALRHIADGNNIVMERSSISNIAFYYAVNGELPTWSNMVLDKVNSIENMRMIYLDTTKIVAIRNALLQVRDKNVLNFLKDSSFYDRYSHFYKTILPSLIGNKTTYIRVKADGTDKQERIISALIPWFIVNKNPIFQSGLDV